MPIMGSGEPLMASTQISFTAQRKGAGISGSIKR
jgi:hypothetical protein